MTPLEFAFADAFTVVGILAVIGGLGWLIFSWLPRKWDAAAGKSIDGHAAAAAETCLYCRGYRWTADCTCPQRCTAMVCLAPVNVAKGLDQ